MEIRINNQKIDFTLENEKNLGDVLNGVESWMKDSDSVIISVKLGDRDLFYSPKKTWEKIPIEEIDFLNITVKRLNDAKISNLETVHQYLGMLYQAVDTANDKQLNELLQGYSLMHQSLDSFLISNPDLLAMDKFFQGATVEMFYNWTSEMKNQALSHIQNIDNLVISRVGEAIHPREALVSVREQLKTSVKEISEVSVLLQTGQDRVAMEHIIRFSDLAQSLLRVFANLKSSLTTNLDTLTISGKTSEDFYNELNSILKELIEAFQAKDSVLIGDLLEYEIAPRLEALIDFTQRIEEHICSK